MSGAEWAHHCCPERVFLMIDEAVVDGDSRFILDDPHRTQLPSPPSSFTARWREVNRACSRRNEIVCFKVGPVVPYRIVPHCLFPCVALLGGHLGCSLKSGICYTWDQPWDAFAKHWRLLVPRHCTHRRVRLIMDSAGECCRARRGSPARHKAAAARSAARASRRLDSRGRSWPR